MVTSDLRLVFTSSTMVLLKEAVQGSPRHLSYLQPDPLCFFCCPRSGVAKFGRCKIIRKEGPPWKERAAMERKGRRIKEGPPYKGIMERFWKTQVGSERKYNNYLLYFQPMILYKYYIDMELISRKS